MSKKYHENYLRRVEMIQRITSKYYEAGRMDRCYAEVWRRWVYPIYPCCYETYRNMLSINVSLERKRMQEAVDKPLAVLYQQPTLFDLNILSDF